ncbi:MAG: NAD(P)H-binding protein [Bacillus sp. (in: Bacteria)]|nr:NAD(P)H-binding protein [Bacillus sp. (in: firmicutes)]
MKIVILGASGRVGAELVRLGLKGGDEITAFVRNKDSFAHVNHPNLTVFEGNALNPEAVYKSIQNQNMVISALSTDKNQVLSKSIPLIIEGMEAAGVNRIITIGTAGILNARSNPSIYRYQSGESRKKRTTATEDHAKVYESLKKTNLDWTIFCPTYMPAGPATNSIRYELDFLPEEGKQVTVDDVAMFTYQNKSNPAFLKRRVGLTE